VTWFHAMPRVLRHPDPGSGRAPTANRPLVPGIPSRRVDATGVVRRQKMGGQETATGSRKETPPSDGGHLTIGVGVRYAGEILRCHRLSVAGEVDATVPAASLEVLPDGRFTGAAEVENAHIAGVFDGNLTVYGQLSITGTGRVNGVVRYGNLEIESGGQISGDVQVRGREKVTPAAAAAGSPAARAESESPPLRELADSPLV